MIEIIRERTLDGGVSERLPQEILDEYYQQDEIIRDLRHRLYEICKVNWRLKGGAIVDIDKYIPEDIIDTVIDEIETENEAYYNLIKGDDV